MTEQDVIKFVSEAVDSVECIEDTKDRLSARVKLAKWLRSKYSIAIKEMKISLSDGSPHLIVEYIDDESEIKECSVNVKKWESNFV